MFSSGHSRNWNRLRGGRNWHIEDNSYENHILKELDLFSLEGDKSEIW